MKWRIETPKETWYIKKKPLILGNKLYFYTTDNKLQWLSEVWVLVTLED